MEIFMQIDSTRLFEWDVSSGGNFEMDGIPIGGNNFLRKFPFELKESIFHVKEIWNF